MIEILTWTIGSRGPNSEKIIFKEMVTGEFNLQCDFLNTPQFKDRIFELIPLNIIMRYAKSFELRLKFFDLYIKEIHNWTITNNFPKHADNWSEKDLILFNLTWL